MGWEITPKVDQPLEVEDDSCEEDSRTNKNGGEVEKAPIQIKKGDFKLPIWRE